jgi:hypothetical protein
MRSGPRLSPQLPGFATRFATRVKGADKHVSIIFMERQSLTMRINMRRFTRLTNAFSKKIDNHAHAVALHFMYYNLARIHKALRVASAMEAGVSDHVWTCKK